MKLFKKEALSVKQYPTRRAMGEAAATDVAERIKELLAAQERVNMIFAAAPSQNEFLETLVSARGIDWGRVNAFHMDEYTGLEAGAPQAFSNFLRNRLFSKLPFGNVFYLDSQTKAPAEECARYAALLAKYPTDIVCLGIGENGHIAFNDPHVALFDDPQRVKVVSLDEQCRQQQVNDGCFASLGAVPTHALTLTIPALMAGRYMYCIVPAMTKAWAVRETLCGPVSEACPASVLRTKETATLYLDTDSASLL